MVTQPLHRQREQDAKPVGHLLWSPTRIEAEQLVCIHHLPKLYGAEHVDVVCIYTPSSDQLAIVILCSI